MIFVNDRELRQAVKAAIVEAGNEVVRDVVKVGELKKAIAAMEINRDKKQEEWDRREREIEHKVGLERKRQEFEIEQAKRETSNSVREENLAADKERFKSEMDFQRKHLQDEIAGLRTLVGQLLERVPSAEILDIRER